METALFLLPFHTCSFLNTPAVWGWLPFNLHEVTSYFLELFYRYLVLSQFLLQLLLVHEKRTKEHLSDQRSSRNLELLSCFIESFSAYPQPQVLELIVQERDLVQGIPTTACNLNASICFTFGYCKPCSAAACVLAYLCCCKLLLQDPGVRGNSI